MVMGRDKVGAFELIRNGYREVDGPMTFGAWVGIYSWPKAGIMLPLSRKLPRKGVL